MALSTKTLLPSRLQTETEPIVDLNFVNSSNPLERGHVPILQSVDESRLDEYIASSVSKPSCGSVFARTCTCIASSLTGIGLIAVCAKTKMIKPDEIGLARGFNGDVYVLSQGCNVTQTFFRDVHVFKKSDNNITLHPMHIIRILPGHYGLCRFDGVPHILAPGRHFINDPLFSYEGAVQATAPYIQNGTIHIIIVPTGQVAVCTVKGVGHMLEPGRHFINNPDFEFTGGFVKANAEHIRACAKHRVLIPMGQVGLGWRKNEGVLLEANKAYYIDDPDFKFDGSCSMLQEKIEHGAFKVITVNKGLVGVAFDGGHLTILEPGRHIVDRETFNFSAMLSTGQETIPIDEIVNLSSDNVGLRFSAALNVQVIDARKAVTMLGRDLSRVADTRARKATEFSSHVFHQNIRDRARLALSIIIGNNPFTETFLSTSAIATVHDSDGDVKEGESFKGIIHDAFMSKFSTEMVELCGVKVIDMSIADIDIVNKELSHALAQAAVKATELEMARIDRNVETQRAETDVKSLKIRAEGEGAALLVETDAAAEEIEIIAQAEADRIVAVDKALSGTSEATQMRELIVASGATMRASKSAIVCANSASHLAQMLAGKVGGGSSGSSGKKK